MGSTKYLAPVLSNIEIAPGFFDIRLETPQVQQTGAGQFYQILCDGKPLRRPISVCGFDKEKNILRMVYQIRGEGTAWLATVKSGDMLDLLGPLGHGFSITGAQNPVFVGGGIGTPPMLGAAALCGGKADAILGYRTAGAAILLEDFEKVCRKVYTATDDGTLGHHGLVTDLLKERLAEGPCDLICACGPTPMLKAVSAMAIERDIKCQVSLEQRMGCGIGACVCCVCKVGNPNDPASIRHAQVCRYGPVIDAKEVIW